MFTIDHSQFDKYNIDGGDINVNSVFYNIVSVINYISSINSNQDTVSSISFSDSANNNCGYKNSSKNVDDKLWPIDVDFFVYNFTEDGAYWLRDVILVGNVIEDEIMVLDSIVVSNNTADVHNAKEDDGVANTDYMTSDDILKGYNVTEGDNSTDVYIANNTIPEVDNAIEDVNLIEEDDIFEDNNVAKVHDIAGDDYIPKSDNYAEVYTISDIIRYIIRDDNIINFLGDNVAKDIGGNDDIGDTGQGNNNHDTWEHDYVDDIGDDHDDDDIGGDDNGDGFGEDDNVDDIGGDDNADEDDSVDDVTDDDNDSIDEDDTDDIEEDDDVAENGSKVGKDKNVDEIGEHDNVDNIMEDDYVDDTWKHHNVDDIEEDTNVDNTVDIIRKDNNVTVINEDDNIDNIVVDYDVVAKYYNSLEVDNVTRDDSTTEYKNISKSNKFAEVCITEYNTVVDDKVIKVDIADDKFVKVDNNNDQYDDNSVSTDDQNSDSDNTNASDGIKYSNNNSNYQENGNNSNTVPYHDSDYHISFYHCNADDYRVPVNDNISVNDNDNDDARPNVDSSSERTAVIDENSRSYYSHGIFVYLTKIMDLLGTPRLSQRNRKRSISTDPNKDAKKMKGTVDQNKSIIFDPNQFAKKDHLTSAPELQNNHQKLMNSADNHLFFGALENNITPFSSYISDTETNAQSINYDIVNTDTVDAMQIDDDTSTIDNASQGVVARYPPNLPDLIHISQLPEGYQWWCQSKVYFCGICNEKCTSRYIIMAHLRCFNSQKSFLFCERCTTVVGRKCDMLSHFEHHR